MVYFLSHPAGFKGDAGMRILMV